MGYGLPTMEQSFKNVKCLSAVDAHFVHQAYVWSIVHTFILLVVQLSWIEIILQNSLKCKWELGMDKHFLDISTWNACI